MPQLQQIDTFLSQAFWLVIAFVVLFLVLRTMAIPKIQATLEARREKIEGDIDKAQMFRQESEQVLAEYEAAIAEGRDKAQSAIRNASEEAKANAAAEHEQLTKRLAEDIRVAEDRIASARNEAIGNIRHVAADIVQTMAERLIGTKISKISSAAVVDSVAEQKGTVS